MKINGTQVTLHPARVKQIAQILRDEFVDTIGHLGTVPTDYRSPIVGFARRLIALDEAITTIESTQRTESQKIIDQGSSLTIERVASDDGILYGALPQSAINSAIWKEWPMLEGVEFTFGHPIKEVGLYSLRSVDGVCLKLWVIPASLTKDNTDVGGEDEIK